VVVSDAIDEGPSVEANLLSWQNRIPKPAMMDFTKRPVAHIQAPPKEKKGLLISLLCFVSMSFVAHTITTTNRCQAHQYREECSQPQEEATKELSFCKA